MFVCSRGVCICYFYVVVCLLKRVQSLQYAHVLHMCCAGCTSRTRLVLGLYMLYVVGIYGCCSVHVFALFQVLCCMFPCVVRFVIFHRCCNVVFSFLQLAVRIGQIVLRTCDWGDASNCYDHATGNAAMPPMATTMRQERCDASNQELRPCDEKWAMPPIKRDASNLSLHSRGFAHNYKRR